MNSRNSNVYNSVITKLGSTEAAQDHGMHATISSLLEEYMALKIEADMLRANNSELMSANEELCALNTEFHLSNLALKAKLKRSDSSYNKLHIAYLDLYHLISLNGLAAMFVDRHYQITRCTDNLSRVLPFTETKVGQSVSIVARELKIANIKTHIDEVWDTLQSKRVKTRAQDGKEYVVRISYFKDQGRHIEEAVIGLRKNHSACPV